MAEVLIFFQLNGLGYDTGGKFLRQVGMPLIGKTNAGINGILKMFSIESKLRLFSPFIIAAGHKEFRWLELNWNS